MTFRQHFECASCGKVTVLRVQLGYRDVETIRFFCAECELPISADLHLDQSRGRIIGYRKIVGAKLVNDGAFDYVVNHSSNFAQTSGMQGSELGSSFVEAFRRGGGGERMLYRMRRQQLLQQTVDGHLHEIEQMVRLYEAGKWQHFTRLTEKYLFEDETMRDVITRESALLRAMEEHIGPLVLSLGHSEVVDGAWRWIEAVRTREPAAFADFARTLRKDGYLTRAWSEGLDLYLRFLSSLEGLRQVLSTWDPDSPDAVDAPNLVITGSIDFDRLKALYVDSYEFLSRFLTLTSALENIEKRGDKDAYLPHPAIKKFAPRDMAAFHHASNAPKVAYAQSPFARNLADAMEPALRNGLGHYGARLDRDTGRILYPRSARDATILTMPYASFLLRLLRLALRVQESIYLAKFLRTYSGMTDAS